MSDQPIIARLLTGNGNKGERIGWVARGTHEDLIKSAKRLAKDAESCVTFSVVTGHYHGRDCDHGENTVTTRFGSYKAEPLTDEDCELVRLHDEDTAKEAAKLVCEGTTTNRSLADYGVAPQAERCGTVLEDWWVFCPRCGTAVPR